MVENPSTNDANGRDARGKFAPGNKGGPGNPFAKKTAQLRAALLDAVTPEDIDAVVRSLVDAAKAGDVPACRELLDRVLGRPVESDLVERIDELEKLLSEARRW